MKPDTVSQPRSWLALAQALIAGAVLPLAFSPLDLWPLQLLSVAWLYALLQTSAPRRAAELGLAYGLGAFGVGTSWVYVSIHDFGNAPPPLAGFITAGFVLLLASCLALQCYAYRRFCKHAWAVVPSFAALWVLDEWLRGWLFTGFPWLYLGYAQVTTLFSGLAPLFGVLGLSFFIALSGALLGELALRWRRLHQPDRLARTRISLALLMLWALCIPTRNIAWTTPLDAPPLRVALVQGNIEQSVKFDPNYLQQALERYSELSLPLWRNDLLVWPETAIPLVYQRVPALVEQWQLQADAAGATLISGIFFEDEFDGSIHNSLVAFGEGEGVWLKQKLVPFGEYVPLRRFLSGLLQLFALPQSSLEPGPADQQTLWAGDASIAPFICYEVVYADFVRRYGRDADLLLTVSNDTWFGSSWGPHQHLQMAAMRARELGRYMLRATNNGITALINERGHIIARAPQFTATTLEGEALRFSGRTPFARWGNWPVLMLSLVIVALSALLRSDGKK
ncbi:MAG: apolipoprotein N-acyltransferase [Pseudomonadales bacterium]|jgi:apolipoprotein N-acyltransferase|nr:apolipoprotein N-acyltransferase [Pseudomonadales bacterium]